MKKLILAIIMICIAFGTNAQIDRSQQPEPGPSPKVKVGQPKSFIMKNGMKVMVVENHKLPSVNITLQLDNPPALEGDKKGIADMTGQLLGNGTEDITKDDFQEEIDFMGAQLQYFPEGAVANTLSRYFDRVLKLFADGFIKPNFDQDDFDRDINRMVEALKSSEKDVQSNANRVENVLAFGAHHPKGEFVTENKLKALTLDDVKAHYKSYYLPNNAYLTIIGDVDFEEVKEKVENYFSAWKKGKLPRSKYDEPKDFGKTEINFVDMPNAVQSEVNILNLSHLKMTDSDYYAALVANQIYGGDFNSYLNMSLREDNGWTYGARSSITADKEIGKARGGASVRNAVTDSTVVVALEQLDKIRNTKPETSVLETVKAGMIGSFVMNVEKPSTVARFALKRETQDLPKDFYENYVKNISSVTPEEVQAAAQKYFSYDNAKILVVGKASEVLDGLKKLGYPIKYYDRFGNPTKEPELKIVDADVNVQTVMDKYIAAIGGDKAKTVKTLTLQQEAEVQGSKLNMTSVRTDKGQLLQEMTMMGNVMSKTAFDGDSGYVIAQGQKKTMEKDEIIEMKANAFPFPELELGQNEEAKITGIESFEDKDAYAVKTGDTTIFYDVETGLKLGSKTTFEAQDQEMTQSIVFDKYEDYEGVLIPTEMIMEMGMKITFKVTDVEFDKTYENSYFE